MNLPIQIKKNKFWASFFPFLAFLVLCGLGLSGCANSDRKVFVYGFGNMSVPKDATIADINSMVQDRYGAELFWSPR